MLPSYYNKGCDGFHISCNAMPSQIPRRFLSEEYQFYLFPMLNMLWSWALCNKHSILYIHIYQDISSTVSLIHYKSWYNLNRFSKCNWLIWIFPREQPSWCIGWLSYVGGWFRIMTRTKKWDEHFSKETEIIIAYTTPLHLQLQLQQIWL